MPAVVAVVAVAAVGARANAASPREDAAPRANAGGNEGDATRVAAHADEAARASGPRRKCARRDVAVMESARRRVARDRATRAAIRQP